MSRNNTAEANAARLWERRVHAAATGLFYALGRIGVYRTVADLRPAAEIALRSADEAVERARNGVLGGLPTPNANADDAIRIAEARQ